MIYYDTHDILVGQITATHADEAVLKDGKIDLKAVDPLLFDMARVSYYTLAERVAGTWKACKRLKKKLKACG